MPFRLYVACANKNPNLIGYYVIVSNSNRVEHLVILWPGRRAQLLRFCLVPGGSGAAVRGSVCAV